jgi:hypothetical protein
MSEVFYCFSGGRFVVIASGGCMGSYSCLIENIYRVTKSRQSELRRSYVASFPAYFNIILLPPVTCYQLSCIALSWMKVPGWSELKWLGEMDLVESS